MTRPSPTSAALRATYERHRDELEDFWSRGRSRPHQEREFLVFGRPVRLSSNAEDVLAAAEQCRAQYSTAPRVAETPLAIQVVVNPAPVAPGPAPDELARHIQYTADGDWMAMLLGAWGHCQIDLREGRALAVLTPELAARPDLVSQWLLNTILTNLLMARGLAMLHATCLLRPRAAPAARGLPGDHALLLMAPHNSGKSTTALRLALAGYRLLSDSQVYVAPADAPLGVQLMGFPVGRVRLREDVAQDFPELRPLLEAEAVRHETKYTLDLRRYNPALVQEAAVQPPVMDVCLLRRAPAGPARLTALGEAEVQRAVVLNSLHAHTEAVWERNLAVLAPLVERARWHRLEIGPAADEILAALERIWE
jgi:hypothetical protein